MSEQRKPPIGSIGWVDLTVENAPRVRDFYRQVVGWTSSDVDMGDYADFSMLDADGAPAAGVCHARGTNADLPPVWMIYIVVEDVDAAAQRCQAEGGEILVAPKDVGGAGRYCVIRDSAGAVAALYAHT